MPFIRAQKQKGKTDLRDDLGVPQNVWTYYWLVESYRDKKGRPRQRKLLYLGTVEIPLTEALKYLKIYKKDVKKSGKFIAGIHAKYWRDRMYLRYG